MLLQGISREIKSSLNGFDANKMQQQMLKHYKTMKLIDDKGKWASPELQKISRKLLPHTITEEKSKKFIDEIIKIAAKNQYLVSFIKKAQNENFADLFKKVKSEGKTVFPDLVAYSFVLENLTKAMYNDPQILEDCIKVFHKERKYANYKSFFHRLKHMSIEPAMHNYIKAHKTGIAKDEFMGMGLSVNNMEATITDFKNGFKDNAKTGTKLATVSAGIKKYDPRTDEGPTNWSEDKKAVCASLPLPCKWNDLYQTWNMAFVSSMPDFPYIIPKLLIPQVANYQDKPKEYLYNRVLSLYILLNHEAFDYAEKLKNKENAIDWSEPKLTHLWGKVNLDSANKYLSDIARKKQVKKEVQLVKERMLGGGNKNRNLNINSCPLQKIHLDEKAQTNYQIL